MIFDKFPFTTYEKINLDWLLKKMQECIDAVSNFIVDQVLNITSTHAIANKAVCEALNTKLTVNNDRVSYTNLDSDLQSAYNKANAALQAVPDTYRTAQAQDAIDDTKQDRLFPNGLNVDEVNNFVVVTGTDGGGVFSTRNINALYKASTTRFLDISGAQFFVLEKIDSKCVELYIFAEAGTVASDLIITLYIQAAGNEQLIQQNTLYSRVINTDSRYTYIKFMVMGEKILSFQRQPVIPTSASNITGRVVNTISGRTLKYIKAIQFSTPTEAFPTNSTIYMEATN